MGRITSGKVINGDCIDKMKEIPDNSVHSSVTDTPYALGFMSKSWDTFSNPKKYQEFCYEWGKEDYRVLMPGSYLLAFGGTRTYHRLVCGLEDAGFKIKDCIMWLYGSGFVKNHDISKAIDGYYGLEREKGEIKVDSDGRMRAHEPHGKNSYDNLYGTNKIPSSEFNQYVSLPNSEEAKHWQGWGTALSPAVEPIVVAQKPYEKTYANNVLQYGVGGLNIDKCRVEYTPSKETDNRIGTDKTWGSKREASKHTVSMPAIEGMLMYKNKGRWPSNVLLGHHPECIPIGSKVVKTGSGSPNIVQKTEDTFFFSKLGTKIKGYGSKEIVDAWSCHPQCPIRLMDEQSGILKTGNIKPYHHKVVDPSCQFLGEFYHYNSHKGDKGGASRYFPRFHYSGKAYKTERNAGCYDLYWDKTNEEMKQITKEEYDLLPKDNRAKYNPVATLKPINLMRWLVRLITPKGGVVLDPFAGSGSTLIACVIEGFNYIGIEKQKAFAEIIIPKRLEFWKDPKNWNILKPHNSLPKIKKLQTERLTGMKQGRLF